MDPHSGLMTSSDSLPPDFLLNNPKLFESKKGNDPDTPGIMEALSGPHREEFLQAMQNETEELEKHGTWTVMKRSEVPKVKQKDGTLKEPTFLAGTWAFKVKRFPSGVLRKIKSRFCARGDLQTDVDPHETHAPVASWSSIRMLTITALQRGWATKQIDFSNAFVQAPMARDVHISLPAMFGDTNGIPASELCLKLNKSLHGLREAPKLWGDWLAKGLVKAGFKPSDFDPAVFFGHGMALVVHVDDVLLFGPDEKAMNEVLKRLELQKFDFKMEKDSNANSHDFLGINVTETKVDGKKKRKMTQLTAKKTVELRVAD